MKMDCIEYAAPFFPQAAAEGRIEDYFAAVKNLYNDRCPYDPEVDWELVSSYYLPSFMPDHRLVSIESDHGLYGAGG